MKKAYLVPHSTASHIQHISAFLGMQLTTQLQSASYVVGWGYKRTGRNAANLAQRMGVRPLYVEDGFLALAPGMNARKQRLSLVADSSAPYFDTSKLSELEELLRGDFTAPAIADNLISRWKQLNASKYATTPTHGVEARALPSDIQEAVRSGREIVVLIDQIKGDASLAPAYAGERPFERMVELARMTHPKALLVVRKHPREGERDRFGRRKIGSLTVHKLTDAVSCEARVPLNELCEVATRVYTVTSHAGFEALLWGAPVTCVGHPWYAGWSLTHDCFTPPRRQGLPQRTTLELFWAAYGRYARYVHPATGRRITLEQALGHLEQQYQRRSRVPARIAVVDCQYWKQDYYRDFFPGAQMRFVSSADIGQSVDSSWTLVSWGQRIAQGVVDRWRAKGFTVLQTEDGFLRSVGLGCELVRPLSLCFDDRGLYADPRTDSQLLQAIQRPLDEGRIRDVLRFMTLHRDLRLSKYLQRGQREAVASQSAEALGMAQRPILLLCGQVSDDVSVRTSGCTFASFERLAQELKRRQPDAFLIYRPHPDVVRGLRPGELEVPSADLNDALSPTRSLVEVADEVHVINSLVGFEALLLGKTVHTWGRSWYAGWGLTRDALQEPRGHRATVLQLAHAAYIDHPVYFEPRSRQFINACIAAEVLAAQREETLAAPSNWVQRLSRPLPRNFVRWVAARMRAWVPVSRAG